MDGATGIRARVGRVGRGGRVELWVLGVLAYVPFLLSAPGKVSADTKQYLYLDPGRLLERAPYLWDAHVGAGTVPHQNIGYLFPMGPYYWLMDQLGVPDWVAQRIWMGSIVFAAGAGALWLLRVLGIRRAGAIAGALVYMLAPYQVALTARLSVILLPWAALPWLVGLTARAVKRGGWRDPALFALVALAAGSVSAPSLLLVGIAPVLWLVFSVIDGRASWRVALGTGARIGGLTAGVSIWWATGLLTQARYGIPILDVTETLDTVARASNPTDILRGFGNWFLYGADRLGPWLDQSDRYFSNWVVVATFAVPVLALVAAAVVRWKHRAFFVALVVVGTIVGVGAWPYDHPSPLGSLFKDSASGSAFGLALRNTPRVVPVVVLGLAGLIAAGVSALAQIAWRRRQLEPIAAFAVVAVVLVAFAPVWEHGHLSSRLQRPEDIPSYWTDAAAALDDHGVDTRVLEIPGSLFAAYRWGNAVDPITPGLTERPWIGQELLPFGSRESVNLLAALDRRIQEGTFEPDALAAVARLLRAGTVLVRSDLEYERYDTPRPRLVWKLLTDPLARGLGEPVTYGPAKGNRATTSLQMFDELELRSSGTEVPPEVALIPVEDARPIVDTAPQQHPVVLAGDGEGIVDAASVGLLRGDEMVLYSAALDGAELDDTLRDDADFVITDTNRRRARRWNSLRDHNGFTERAGETALLEDDEDYRLDPFAGSGDKERTVAEHRGGRVDATGYGGPDEYLPEDRPVHAFDGDDRTAWRVGSRVDPRGERIVLRPDEPVRTGRLTLVQPQTGTLGRWITRVKVRINGEDPVTLDLDDSSRTSRGQTFRFQKRTVRRLEIEVLDVTGPTLDPVGFAEVELGDVRVEEVIRVPSALLERAGAQSSDHRLVLLLSRLRYEPSATARQDEELRLVRAFTLPEERAFSVAGTIRVNPNTFDDAIDEVLGTVAPNVEIRASGHLAGDLDARASSAFDGNDTTAWTAPFGSQEGQSIEVQSDTPLTADHVDLTFVTDGRHSVPTRMLVAVDGVVARTIDVPPLDDRATENATQTVTIPFEQVSGQVITLVVDAVRPVTKTGVHLGTTVVAPVAIAEIGLPGVGTVAEPTTVSDGCIDGLLSIDDQPVAVRMTGAVADARRGLDLELCNGESLVLSRGEHVVRTNTGLDTGIDIDRLVLTSARGGAAAADPTARVGAPPPKSGAKAEVVEAGMTAFDVRVRTDGKPFWLVLGQSLNDGWTATINGGDSLGEPSLVNGYANGWKVDPASSGTLHISLRWTPQRLVWIGITISVVAVLGCLFVLLRTRRRSPSVDIAAGATLVSPLEPVGRDVSWRTALGVALGTGTAAAVVSRLWIGALVAAVTFAATRARCGRVVLLAAPPVALAVSKIADRPELGWVAVMLLGAALVLECAVRSEGDPALAER